MARTISEIYNAIVAEKQAFTELNALQPAIDSSQQLLADLNSTSKVANWRLFTFIVAVAIWVHESLWDAHKTEIETIIANNAYGINEWYNQKAKQFQLGDDVVVENGVIKYETVDVTKRIVAYSATVPGSTIQVKIAGSDGNGNLQKITNISPEFKLDQVQAYFNKIKPAGVRISVTSNDADKLKIYADIYYNPLLIRSDGVLISDGQTRPVDVAINSFLKGIGFNGKLNIQKLTDAIQAVNGVVDVSDVHVWTKYGTTDYTEVIREYFSYAGWMSVDVDFALSDTLTYIANV